MPQEQLPEWDPNPIAEMLRAVEDRLDGERQRARKRALQLAREQAYHRLAVAIDRPARAPRMPGQLTLWPEDPTLFDDAG
jgi:hypothetical protein